MLYMTEKLYALDFSHEEWKVWLEEELSQPKFRADQLCQWLWQKNTFDTEEMTNLSLALREQLDKRLNFSLPYLLNMQKSQIDGTRKYLWQLTDGNTIESVLLKQNDRLTACLSTQVGCPLECTFCATGLSGYVRNLSAGEIAAQFLAMEKLANKKINNIVFMGMGEPFLNIDALLKSVTMLNSEKQRNLGIRQMTVSTSGIIPGIKQLSESGLGIKLAVSLNAADDELRSSLMPINNTYPVKELRMSMVEYQKKTGNRITIEYALLGGVNDSVEQARELVRFLKGIHVYVNLIPYNNTDGRYEKPEAETILKFRNVLTTAGFEAEFRQSLGMDISAACGQLRRKTLANAQSEETLTTHPVKNSGQATKKASAPSQKSRKTESPSDGKKRRADKPESDRYRSGKMKSARPSYRGQSEKDGDTKETRASFGAKTSKAPSKFDASRGKVDKKYKSRTVRDTKKTKDERPGKKKTGK